MHQFIVSAQFHAYWSEIPSPELSCCSRITIVNLRGMVSSGDNEWHEQFQTGGMGALLPSP